MTLLNCASNMSSQTKLTRSEALLCELYEVVFHLSSQQFPWGVERKKKDLSTLGPMQKCGIHVWQHKFCVQVKVKESIALFVFICESALSFVLAISSTVTCSKMSDSNGGKEGKNKATIRQTQFSSCQGAMGMCSTLAAFMQACHDLQVHHKL